MAYQTFTIYSTVQDETWDQVALKLYGAERYANVLIRANPALNNIVFFDAGEILLIPRVAVTSNVAAQPWNFTAALF
jgi:Phage Tail Protein X